MAREPWLLVPVKSLDRGKSRLEPVLGTLALREFNERLLRRLLDAGSRFPGRGRTAVVSRCDAVLRAAESRGARAIRQSSRQGLNPAVEEAFAALRRSGAGAVIVVACDLPLLRAADLRELADAGARRGTILLCPDKHGRGTNAIYLPRGASVRFRFGVDSLRGHLAEAVRAGFAPGIHFSSRIACDIDTPADLRQWQARARRRAGGCVPAGLSASSSSARGAGRALSPARGGTRRYSRRSR